MRIAAVLIGVVIAVAGGVLAYRAAFLGPHAAYVVTNTAVHEVPNVWRIIGGAALFIAGACLAFFAARGRRA